MVASNPTGIGFNEVTSTTGIIFVPFTKVQLSYKEWKLVYFYDLNKYYKEVTIIEHFYNRLTKICDRTSTSGQEDFANTCHLAISHVKYHMEKVLESRNIIKSYNSFTIRKRRAPLNVVGSLASSLFGVLDQSDADRYNSEIMRIKNDQNYQNELLKKQTLITERLTQSTNITLSEIITGLTKINDSLTDLITSKNWSAIRQNFNAITATLALILIDHDQITDEIKSILSHTLKGEVIDLIPINQLRDNLNVINGKIAKNEEMAIDLKMESVYNIFKTSTIHTILKNDIVIIEIGIPILEMEELDIFRAIPIPTRIGQEYAMILPSSDMFITNAEKSQYIPWSTQELSECINRNSKGVICKQIEPIRNGEHNTCELTLLSKPYIKSLPQNCVTRKVPSGNYIIYLHELNKFFCVIDSPIQFQTICPNTTDTFKMEKSGILEIKNNCYIKSEDFIIKSHTIKRYESGEIIKPKFNLSDIINTESELHNKPNRGKSEIFIKDHYTDFNAIANDISKLRDDEEDKRLLHAYNDKIRILNASSVGIISTLILLATIFIGLKIRKHLSLAKTEKKPSNDIEMQTENTSTDSKNYAEIKRQPTPFSRRSLS